MCEFNKYICFFLSPSGKLVQIEYALAAVAGGAPSVGIKGNYIHSFQMPINSYPVVLTELSYNSVRTTT